MPQIAYFDCFSGISGDMALGALIDAGVSIDQLRDELHKLNVPGWTIEAERTVRYNIAGTRLHVNTAEQHTHRHLADIAHILEASTLTPDVRQRSLAIFTRLAEAEAAVHGTSRDEVHFHEVGALDAIVDVVGFVIGLKLLGIEQVFASPLPLGSGWIDMAHGRLPIPGPAVLNLLGAVGAPIQPDTTPFELTTPTGAALLAELATFDRPALRLLATGYGFGGRDTGRLNAVRVWIGTTEQTTAPQNTTINSAAQNLATSAASTEALQSVVLLQTNIDDQPAEQLAYVAEQLLRPSAQKSGALDVWWTAIGMKKSRSAVMLSVLVQPDDEAAAVEAIFRETTSLGVRRQVIERWVCDRAIRSVATPWGSVRVKEQRRQGELLGIAPEYEDCAAIAREYGVPLRVVYEAARKSASSELTDA